MQLVLFKRLALVVLLAGLVNGSNVTEDSVKTRSNDGIFLLSETPAPTTSSPSPQPTPTTPRPTPTTSTTKITPPPPQPTTPRPATSPNTTDSTSAPPPISTNDTSLSGSSGSDTGGATGAVGDALSVDITQRVPSASPAPVTASVVPQTQLAEQATEVDRSTDYVRDAAPFIRSGDASKEQDDHVTVVGGRNGRQPSRDVSSKVTASESEISLSYEALQYVAAVSTVISTVLLVGFQCMAIDERFDLSGIAFAPNTWEFVVYASYVQHLLSMSQLVLIKTPYSVWKVLDALSWAGFLPYHSNESAISRPAVSDASGPASRRLETILLSGIVSFADRVGIKEANLLARTSTGLAVVACAFLLCFFVFAALAKQRDEVQNDRSLDQNFSSTVSRVDFWRSITMRVCGLLVLLWFFALLPLSTMSTYEVAMEIRAGSYSADQLLLAGISLLVVCLGGLFLVCYTVSSKTQCELGEQFNITAWGCLYADYTYTKRSFLVAPVVLQIFSGVLVGAVSAPYAQLSLLIGAHAIFLLAIWTVAPFRSGSVAPWFVVAVMLLKITNLVIAMASFSEHNSWSSAARESAGDALVYLNLVVLLAWLLRHFAMLVQTVRCLRGSIDARFDDRTLSFCVQSQQPQELTSGFSLVEENQLLQSLASSTSSRKYWSKRYFAAP